tara:strand:- start:487 stop:1134 length:648 start_codon:yes stop_codon:yes gene_type:complete
MYSTDKKDKILITGASSGLGYYLSKCFSNYGHDLIITGRNTEKLNEMKSKLPTSISVVSGDLLNLNHIQRLRDKFISSEATVLINNAGVTCSGLPLDKLSVDRILDTINVNLTAPFLLTKYLYNHLTSLININSMVGLEHKKHRTAYGASKWGLKGFSESLKLETSINIVDVYPTSIKTTPNRKNAMEVDFVCQKIYETYNKKITKKLVLDGRPK